MPQPCEQQHVITNISHTLERMEKTQDRLVVLLEKVAGQDARLDHLEEHAENSYKSENEIFNRLRDVELNQAVYGPETKLKINDVMEELTRKMDDISNRFEKLLRFYRLTTSRNALYLYGFILAAIVFGLGSDIYNHYDWVKSIWHFYKG